MKNSSATGMLFVQFIGVISGSAIVNLIGNSAVATLNEYMMMMMQPKVILALQWLDKPIRLT